MFISQEATGEQTMSASSDDEWVSVQVILEEIRQVYRHSKRDWIVAFSGGKDSTATLQLIWYALTALPPEERLYHVYVVSNDTLVEDPAMATRVHLSCQRINAAAENLARQYPKYTGERSPLFSAHVLKPRLHERFFYLLIGLVYPAPTVKTRWCVQRLKLNPAQAFIESHISQKGEVVLTLGAREEESTERARSLRRHSTPGQLLKRHSTMPGAWVYTPIEVWKTDDVWQFLLQVENPWGDTNRDLMALYLASSGECPLVIDRKTSSCAGGRMGCWTCSVAATNHSLAHRVDSGEEWLIPLLDFRDYLVATTDPQRKQLYRSLEARGTHLIQLNRQGRPSYRCYTLDTRKDLLSRLLQVQEQVRRKGPDPQMQLIDFEELCAIREVWRSEGDWEDSLPLIYREVTGHDEPWPVREDERWMNAGTKAALLSLCRQYQLSAALVLEMLEAVRQFQHTAGETVHESDDSSKTDLELSPLFPGNPFTTQQTQATQTLLEKITALLHRDWRTPDERLAEVLTQHEKAQHTTLEQPPLFPQTKRSSRKNQ